MADDRKPLPEESMRFTQDFQIVQVLRESRELASRNGADDEHADSGWRELAGRLDRIMDRMGIDGGEPATRPAMGMDRIDRGGFALEPDTADRAVASLMALGDRPDQDQLELANQAVRDLEDSLR
ncbi:hypothetical protein [Egicoccus sp. AB-alg2]|uniref:hypothetical protein n=1 Tax=Egicoccus sp. AB-alg2 TaxID=3242693 RepID=UPI00359D0DB0